jgi:hypothetical protein
MNPIVAQIQAAIDSAYAVTKQLCSTGIMDPTMCAEAAMAYSLACLLLQILGPFMLLQDMAAKKA